MILSILVIRVLSKDVWQTDADRGVRIPVIAATQSGAKLPLIPAEGCHRFRTKAATPIGAQRRLV